MKYLVTGGAGFIGSNFLQYMTKKYQNDEFICIDALTYAGNYHNISMLEKLENFKFIKGDITDKIFIDKVFKEEKFDYVVNFAAESHVDNSISNPAVFLVTNIIGVQVLLDACRKYGIIRFHQVSTDEVYGDLPLDRNDLQFDELWPLKASSPYSASKASADLLTLAYFKTYNLPVTISRCSNNYGPYQFKEKLIPLVISKALMNESIPIYGNGQNVRDWIYVFDHITGIDAILKRGKVGEIYNLGANQERSNLDVVKIILKLLEKNENLITFVEDRKGHDLRYAIDSTKAKNELEWNIEYTFDDAICHTVNWYLDNQEWMNNSNRNF